MGRNGVEQALGIGLLLLAIALASGIGLARIRWENAYNRVRLAVYLGDLVPSVSWEDLQELGLRAIVVSPKDVSELRAKYFARRREGPSLSLETVRDWTARGLLYWDLDAWVPPASFPAYLEDLFRERPRGFVLSFPYALGPWGADPWRSLLSPNGPPGEGGRLELAVPEFQGFAQRQTLIAVYRSGCRCVPVRAHGLSREDRERLSPQERIARYLRAVRERNVRLLLLRADSLEELRRDVEALTSRLQRRGFSGGAPLPPGPWEIPAGVWALLWIGTAGGTGLVLRRALSLPTAIEALKPRWAVPVGAIALGGAVGLLAPGAPARAALAWGIAASAPALGVFLAYRWVRSPLASVSATAGVGAGAGAGVPPTLKRAVQAFLLGTAVSAAGGLLAAALLSSDLYFLKLEEPRGIKAALALPPGVVAVGLLWGGRYRVRDFRLGDGVAWGAVLLAVGLALLRSGNFPSIAEGLPLPVPGAGTGVWAWAWAWERDLRGILEDVLGVRPRFKEFLVGHPLLLVGLLLHPRGGRPATAALLALGTIGQVSLVNTFLHLHTPLTLTLLRSLYGVGLGLLLGIGLGGAVQGGRKLLRPSSSS